LDLEAMPVQQTRAGPTAEVSFSSETNQIIKKLHELLNKFNVTTDFITAYSLKKGLKF
jgi:hypothetical protein